MHGHNDLEASLRSHLQSDNLFSRPFGCGVKDGTGVS